MRQATWRSSARTATGFVNTSIASRCGRTSTACTRSSAASRIVSQSGNIAVNLTIQQRGLRLGMIVSVGNQASVGTEDCIEAFLDDRGSPRSGCSSRRFATRSNSPPLPRRAHAQGVPIVALQTGRSAAGAAIATSHTGSMSGRAAAYDALFERYGIATVTTPAEMLETLKLLDNGGRLERPANRLDELLGRRGVAGG